MLAIYFSFSYSQRMEFTFSIVPFRVRLHFCNGQIAWGIDRNPHTSSEHLNLGTWGQSRRTWWSWDIVWWLTSRTCPRWSNPCSGVSTLYVCNPHLFGCLWTNWPDPLCSKCRFVATIWRVSRFFPIAADGTSLIAWIRLWLNGKSASQHNQSNAPSFQFSL